MQPSFEQMRAFLARRYKHTRFAGRDGQAPGWENYSAAVTQSALDRLAQHGYGFMSHHEAANRTSLRYTAEDVLADASQG